MEFLDARRLTGPNLLCDGPGSILDIACEPEEVAGVITTWTSCIKEALGSLGWEDNLFTQSLIGGVSLGFTAPIDSLYAASEINEWAWTCIEAKSSGTTATAFAAVRPAIEDALTEERNVALLALQQQAAAEEVTFLWDDDEVSLGMGRNSATWPPDALPAPDELDWSRFSDIPLGIVTGTNGKTTCARLATFILRCAGHQVGMSCTDWIAVNDNIIDRGDWSGPGGARNVLRQQTATAAILESARGGLLRRGLGVDRADAALITNIAADHLGDFGSRDLGELLQIKWVVSRAVVDQGTLVLNAEDDLLREAASDYPGKLIWFSLDADSALIRSHLASGGTAMVLQDNQLALRQGADSETICHVEEVPITLAGAAKHNVANALAASALTYAMGTSLTAIRAGLMGMSQDDNPGRCNVYRLGEVNVLVDFAHNPHAMQALFDMATSIPANRRLLAFGQAGDRPDSLIREITQAAWNIGLDRILVSELPQYHRGREHGEVFGIISDELQRTGANAGQILHFETEQEALHSALDWAEPGDLVIMLALGERDVIRDTLAAIEDEAGR